MVVRPGTCRRRRGVEIIWVSCFSMLADVGQVLIELALVGAAQAALQIGVVVHDEVEHRFLAHQGARDLIGRAHGGGTEQARVDGHRVIDRGNTDASGYMVPFTTVGTTLP